MRAVRHAADVLACGSLALLRQFGSWVIDGPWRTILARSVGPIVATGLGLTVLERAPVLWWPLTAAGLIAAWRTGIAIERRAAAELKLVQLLADAIGSRNGVLLSDVLALLHRDRLLTDWKVAELRAEIERLRIPVRDSLKVDGRVSIGVHHDDLHSVWTVQATPPPGDIHNPSPDGSPAGHYPTTSPTQPLPAGFVEGVAEADERTVANLETHISEALALIDEGVNDR